MGPQAYPEMLLAEMARPERAGAKAPTAGVERHGSRRSDEQSWRVESGRPTRAASSFKQLGPATIRLSRSIGSCKPVRLPGSTAGCGKPHVRWCGRVAGRNPRHSTRSRLPNRSTERGTEPPLCERRVGPLSECPTIWELADARSTLRRQGGSIPANVSNGRFPTKWPGNLRELAV